MHTLGKILDGIAHLLYVLSGVIFFITFAVLFLSGFRGADELLFSVALIFSPLHISWLLLTLFWLPRRHAITLNDSLRKPFWNFTVWSSFGLGILTIVTLFVLQNINVIHI